MQYELSTLKTSNLYFPKLHVIKARKNKNINYFLNRNNNIINRNFNLSEKLKTNYLIMNSHQNYTKTPLNTFHRISNNNSPSNFTINKYAYRTHYEINKNNDNNKIKRKLSKEKINKICRELLIKKAKTYSRLKNQAISTCDSFFNRNQSKIKYRYLTLGKDENNLDNISSFRNDVIREICKNKTENISKNKFPLNERISFKFLKDKYAYIYMSDKSELIKYWRRINYNPLNA